jgi:Big-like domain-containing protein
VKIAVKGRPAAAAIAFYVDGTRIASAPPFSTTWDSAAAGPGAHLLQVVATDCQGNELARAQTTIFTGVGVAITSPSQDATESGVVDINCLAASKTRRVDLSVDGARVASSPPLNFQLDSSSLADGQHTVAAAAFGAKNKYLGSYSISITIKNHSPTPSPTPTHTSLPTSTPTPTPTASTSPTGSTTATPTSTASSAPTPGPGGRAYYVAPNGNDSNSGTNPSSPWRSINKVNAMTFSAGDVIYFAAGGVWREILSPQNGGREGNPVSFAGYGTGSRPNISGSDLVIGWTLDSGQIYSAPLSKQPANV